MKATLNNLSDVEAELQRPEPDHSAITEALKRIQGELRLIKLDAAIALDAAFERDLRGAMLVYLSDLAGVHGRTTAEQVAACIREQDPVFTRLALVAWGVVL